MDVAVLVAAAVVAAAAATAAAAAVKRQGQIKVWPPWSEVMPPNSLERGSTSTIIGKYKRYFSVFLAPVYTKKYLPG